MPLCTRCSNNVPALSNPGLCRSCSTHINAILNGKVPKGPNRNTVFPDPGTYWEDVRTGGIVCVIDWTDGDKQMVRFHRVWSNVFGDCGHYGIKAHIDEKGRACIAARFWYPNADKEAGQQYFVPLDPLKVGRMWVDLQSFLKVYERHLRGSCEKDD